MNPSLYTWWEHSSEYLAQFALWNLSGQMVGYYNYRPNGDKHLPNDAWNGKYFTRFQFGLVGVWGMETWKFSNTLFVTEGLFDAARLSSHGVSAVATMSNNPKHLTGLFKLFRSFRPVVAVCDGDSAGKLLSKFGHVSYTMSDDHDVNSASEEEVQYVLNTFK